MANCPSISSTNETFFLKSSTNNKISVFISLFGKYFLINSL